MFGLVARLLGGAVSPIIDQLSETAARLARKVALLLLAALCMVIVVIALTVAFFLWLATVASPVVAALSVAGFYLTIALVAVVVALWGGSGKTAPASETRAPDTEAAKAAEAARAGLESQIDDVIAPLMAFLAKFGLRREQLAVMAGASIAKQIGPIPLVGLAIVGGFLLGRMWKGWRALPDILAGLATSGLFGFGGGDEDAEQGETAKDKAA